MSLENDEPVTWAGGWVACTFGECGEAKHGWHGLTCTTADWCDCPSSAHNLRPRDE